MSWINKIETRHIVSVVLVLLMLSLLSYGGAPDNYSWQQIMPWYFLFQLTFALCFGAGFPLWLAIVCCGVLLVVMFMATNYTILKIEKLISFIRGKNR